MKISNVMSIRCGNCGNILNVNGGELEHITGTNERRMGEEIEHTFTGIYNCEKCGNEIDINVNVWEYPVGAVNLEDSEVLGGEFTVPPIAEI